MPMIRTMDSAIPRGIASFTASWRNVVRIFLQSFAVVIWAAWFALLPLRAEKLWKTLPVPLPLPAPTETGEAQ